MTLPMFSFPDGDSPLAEIVCNGTAYRSHRDHCPGRPTAAPAFSAAAFPKKSPEPKPTRRPRK